MHKETKDISQSRIKEVKTTSLYFVEYSFKQPYAEAREVIKRKLMLRYQCATCGNGCLQEERPDNSICGGCNNPDWKLLKFQEHYIVDTEDYIHPEGEI